MSRHLGGFDEVPEFRVLLQGFVFLHFEPGSKKEILERVAVEDAMDEESKLVTLEVNPVVADPEAVQNAARSLELPELVQLGVHDLLGQAAELAQDLQLELLGHARQFGGTGGIEDYLERSHLAVEGGPPDPAIYKIVHLV